MHRAPAVLEGQASPLRLAVDGHALDRGVGLVGYRNGDDGGGEVRAQRGREGVAVELAEQALQGRLAGRAPVRKAQRAQQVGGLARAPLGNGQDGEVVGEDGRPGQARIAGRA